MSVFENEGAILHILKQIEVIISVIRADLGTYLLLALEVLIAADIIKSIVEPDLIDLGILAGIVAIRTILSVFLNKEIQEIDKERSEKPDMFAGM